jgi:twitching motility protein PilT
MAVLDALLKVLVQNSGDELVLAAGEPPAFYAAGRPLKLFLRTLGVEQHQAILAEVAGLGAWPGGFTVSVRGDRVRVHRGGEVAPTVAEPVGGLGDRLDEAMAAGASDVHIATGEALMLRIDGRLSPRGVVADVEALLAPALGDADRSALAAGASVDFVVQTPSGNRFRGSVYRFERGLAAAFRVLRPEAPALSSLGFPVALDPFVRYAHGLVLVTGPTGSGKSTTMAAMAREALLKRRGVLLTLEDPIEYTFSAPSGAAVRQRQIGRHVSDFPTGLRDALRGDPDLLLIGEMRDPESIQLALTAAETGHLVFASLHSRTASSAVERIVDAYPPERQRQVRVQLADALRAVLAVRLLPRASGTGRVPAVEILEVNTAAAHAIREGKTPQLISVMQTGADVGMVTMERCLQEMVRRGVIREDAGDT